MKKLFWTAAFMLMPRWASANRLSIFLGRLHSRTGSLLDSLLSIRPIDAAATFTLWGGDGSALATANRTIPRGNSRSLDQT
jgi:hypothetical protein